MATRYKVLISRDVGIAQNNTVKVSAADVANGEYAKFTATGLESKTTEEVLSDIGAQASGSYPTAPEITIIKQLTAAQYAALTPKVDTTLYIIVG